MKNFLSKFKVFFCVICICFLAMPQVTNAIAANRVVLTDPGYNLNVRLKPNTSSKVVNKIPPGTLVEISKVSGDWGYIGDGWINLQFTWITQDASGSRKTTDKLNLREAPGTKYSRILTIPKGATLSIYETYNNWTYVKYTRNGVWTYGWVSSSYLK